jgi:hypothetical protein
MAFGLCCRHTDIFMSSSDSLRLGLLSFDVRGSLVAFATITIFAFDTLPLASES